MAKSTVTWNQVAELARNLGAKKIQLGSSDVMVAQLVSSRMYSYRLWQFSLIQSPFQSLPIINDLQDYPAPQNTYRLNQAWITIVVPGSINQSYNLDVVANLTPELNPGGYYGRGQIMYMANAGVLRLSRPIQVSTGQDASYLNVEYQPQPQKITDMGMLLPFPDEYVQIAVEGYLYWLYKFGDDDRAGTTVKQGNSVEYTGQLAVFESLLMEMAGKETAGDVQTMFPSEVLGAGGLWGERSPLGWTF